MTERYDSATAQHYSAFRPPLHTLILERLIRPNESFRAGLDIGCGTGCSAVALAKYCDRVVALDPSQAMLDTAQSHAKVTYISRSGDELSQLPRQAFDVASFAGSLFYTKTNRLRRGLVHACKPGATVLVYDFEVHLDDLLAETGAKCPPFASDYNHAVNLSDWPEFLADMCDSERLQLNASEKQIAHLLLADSKRYDALIERFPEGDLFGSLVGSLTQRSKKVLVHADIYFARYRLLEK
jgi:ubiquinone/menaquinone biosynthesis C-methylase UbiE